MPFHSKARNVYGGDGCGFNFDYPNATRVVFAAPLLPLTDLMHMLEEEDEEEVESKPFSLAGIGGLRLCLYARQRSAGVHRHNRPRGSGDRTRFAYGVLGTLYDVIGSAQTFTPQEHPGGFTFGANTTPNNVSTSPSSVKRVPRTLRPAA